VKLKKLTNTELEVSELGLGGLFISSFGSEFETAKETIARALELGVNYIDTAPDYADSEEVLGKALTQIGEAGTLDTAGTSSVILSTKLGGRPTPFRPQDRDCLRKSIEESLQLLHRDYIDVLFIHEPDRPGQYDWWGDKGEYSGPVTELLGKLKEEGIINYTGLAGTTTSHLAHIMKETAFDFDLVLTAFNYSLLWREAEHEVLPTAKELGLGVIAGSPLQQGALAQKYEEEVRSKPAWLSKPRQRQFLKLYDLVEETGIPLPELALRFVVSNPDIDCVLSGADSPEQVEQNVRAVERGPLAEEMLEELDEIAAMVPFRPFEEPFSLPFGREYKGPGRAG